MRSCFGCLSFFSKRDHSQLKFNHTFSGYKKIDEAFDKVSRQMCWLDLAIQDPAYPATPIAREIKNTIVSLRDCYPQGSGAYRQCWCQLGVILKSLPTHKAQLSWVRKTQQRHSLLSEFHYHEPGFKLLYDKVISGLGSFVNIESIKRYPDQHFLIVPSSPTSIVVDLFTFDCLTESFFKQLQAPRYAYMSPLRLAKSPAVGLGISDGGEDADELKIISL